MFFPTPSIKRSFLLCTCAAALNVFFGTLTLLHAQEKPAPSPRPIDALAARLADAPDDDARDALLAAATPAPDMVALCTALQTVAYGAEIKGDLGRAEPVARYQETLARRAKNTRLIFAAQILQSQIHQLLGEFPEALALLSPMLGQLAGSDDYRLVVSATMARGLVYIHQADYARALMDFRAALAASEAFAYRDGAIPALNSTGEVFRAQGQPARALEYYQRARDWLGDDTAWNNAFLFNNIAMCHLALGDRAKAVEFLQRAGAIAAQTGQKPRAATTLAVLGDVYRKENRFDEARASLDRSLTLARESRDGEAIGRAQLGLAEWERAKGDHPAALAQAEAAVETYRRANQADGLGAAQTAAGREYHTLSKPAQARAAFEEAIAITEAVRGRLVGGDLDAQAYFAGKVTPYQELVALLADTPGGAADALRMAERAKARTLLDIVRRDGPDATISMNAAERARVAELNRRLDALNRRVATERAAAPAGATATSAEAQLDQARRDWDRFQSDLIADHPELGRQRPPAALLSSDDLAHLIAGGKTAALEFVVTDTKTYLLAVGGEGGAPTVRVFALDVDRETLARRVEAFRGELAQRGLNWREAARTLYNDLLKPAEAVWKSAHRLVIVPDGPLWNLPFQALPSSPDHGLVEEYALSYAPSLSFLRRATPFVPAAAVHKLFALGNPTLTGNDFPPLPEAEKQIAAIRALYPPESCRVCIGAEAREDVFKREAPDFDVLHLATHGVINDRNPLFSYLLMAQTQLAPGENGLLEAREFMTMHLHARLAVLSACETGRGRVTTGEGIIGLGWALFVAGCPASVLSQWQVDSAATTPLMVELHRQLRDGVAPDEALRRASLAVASQPQYRHPFYWSPFVLVGAGTSE